MHSIATNADVRQLAALAAFAQAIASWTGNPDLKRLAATIEPATDHGAQPALFVDGATNATPIGLLSDALLQLAQRTLDYVGTGPVDPILDADADMQALAFAGVALVAKIAAEQVAEKVAV